MVIIMKDLIMYLVKSLVDNPDEVQVTEVETDTSIVYELSVAADDMGRVIGKHGKIAKAIRAIVKSASYKLPKKVVVEIK